jgi:uncharacterized protein (DUF1778 family)
MSKNTAENELPEGFFSNPKKIELSDAAFDKLTEIIESKDGPNPKLVELLKRPKRWAN